jgi:2-dehydropantoate 2-reductase
MSQPIRILVVGAGAVGGYFGGRLLEADRDVTFLVRPRRAAELAAAGLRIRSRFGDVTIPKPPAVVAEALTSIYDVVLLSCKAYDLDDAISAFAPAVGPETAILPLLNGMRHIETLSARFGAERVLGGTCFIAATLNAEREIVHLSEVHGISFGERDGSLTDRVQAIGRAMETVRFDHVLSREILRAMWEKWVFLATLAGSTCLFRATIGDIVAAPEGTGFILDLFEECASISASQKYLPEATFAERTRPMLTAAGSPLTSSMLRDIESGGPIEADHIIGDLLARGPGRLLSVVYTALKAYERRRSRS